MSYSCSSCMGKSMVFITIDFPCSPALKAMVLFSLNLLSMMPGMPSKAAKGGTAPGSTPSFLTSSSLHMRLFLANRSTFRNLFQLILRSARQSSRKRDSLPFTIMVFEPHSRGVFLSMADSFAVLVLVCSNTWKGMELLVRQLTILLYTSELYSWGSGFTSYYFYINSNNQHIKHQGRPLNSVRLGSDSVERLVVDLELYLTGGICLRRAWVWVLLRVSQIFLVSALTLPIYCFTKSSQPYAARRCCASAASTRRPSPSSAATDPLPPCCSWSTQNQDRSPAALNRAESTPGLGCRLFVDELRGEAGLDDALERHGLALVLEEVGLVAVDVVTSGPHFSNAEYNRAQNKGSNKAGRDITLPNCATAIQFIDNERANNPQSAPKATRRPTEGHGTAGHALQHPQPLLPQAVLAFLAADGAAGSEVGARGGGRRVIVYCCLLRRVIIISMQKQEEPEIIEKVQLKQKLCIKGTIKEKSEVMIAKFGQEDSLVACGCSDGFVRIYNLIKSSKIAQFNTNIKDKESNLETPVNAIRWRPSSEKLESMGAVVLASNTNGHLFQFIAKTGKQLWHGVETDNQIFALDYASDGRFFATAGRDNVVRIYDEETKKTSHALKGELRYKAGHSNRIFAVKFKPENPVILASGGWDQNVHIWDLRVGEVTQTLVGPRITGDAIDFREDMILTGSSRVSDQLQLWDYRTKEILHTYTWDEKGKNSNAFLNSCQFCPNSKNTVLAAGGQQLKMFTLDDHSELLELRLPEGEALYSCDTSAINNKYLTGGKKGVLYYLATNKFAE